MTYPPQQPLSQDPRYAYAPAYGQQPQQQYGGAPAAQPQQLGGQPMPTSAPALGQSGRTGQGGPTAPAPRHLVGRTVIFEPIRIDETTKDDKGELRPTAHYHLTVVDGGPLQYGDNRDHDISKQHGMTFEVQTPCRFVGVSSDRYGIVNEVRDALARGDMASVGVVVQGTKGNRPFLVTKTGRDLDGNERPDGGQRFEAATQVWNAIFSKTFVTPEPRSLVAAPAVAPPPVQYQPQPPQGPTYGTAGGAPQYVTPAPAQYATYAPAGAQQQYPTPGTAGGYQQYAQQPPMIPGYTGPITGAGIPQEYHIQPPQPSPFAQAARQEQPPVNPAFEAWLATLPPEQQAAQRQAMATQQPGGPGI